MHFRSSVLAAAVSILSLTSAHVILTTTTPGKRAATKPDQVTNNPVISPTFVWAELDAVLATQLPKHHYVSATVATGELPSACIYEAAKNTLDAADFKSVRVQYDDCGDSWVFCIHKDAPETDDEIVTAFGQMPIGYRTYIQTPIAVNHTYIGSAYTRGNVTVFSGGSWTTGILAHEIGHALDFAGFDTPVHDRAQSYYFSNTSLWQAAEGGDAGVPTAYGRKTWQEDFAEISRMCLYDLVVPGGLRSVNPRAVDDLRHQIQIYEHFLGSRLFPASGRCERRVPEPSWAKVGSVSSFVGVDDEPDAVKEMLEAHRGEVYV